MIEIKDKKSCCGCELCKNVCPTSAIDMCEDEEGFLYPYLAKPDACIKCSKCINSCPENKRIILPRPIEGIYTGFAKNETIIKSCSSGGVATVISQKFIEEDGVVYGIQYSDDFKSIVYERADSIEKIEKFRGSKYSQSKKNEFYRNVQDDLKAGTKVLVFGLPCDIAALYNYTKNKFENLYTIELVCHGVTSPKVHKEFIESIEHTHKLCKLTNFSVRYKKDGWKPYYIHEEYDNGESNNYLFRPTNYGIAFHYLKRPSCNFCRFKVYDKEYGMQADLTIGDNHGVSTTSQSYHKWGSSMSVVHTDKGQYLMRLITDIFQIVEDDKSVINHNLALFAPFPEKNNRSKFSNVFVKQGLEAACHIPSVRWQDFKISARRKIGEMHNAILIFFKLRQ